jgi:photosystem II stability/assembly factor-like uncharacterized protein
MKYSNGVVALLSLATVSALCQAPRLDPWKVIGPGGGGTMIAPIISPHDPSLVVEHCDMTGGYITGDNGRSWRMFNLRGGIETFAFDAARENVIYAGNSALWRTTDRGQTWKMLFPSPSQGTVEHQVGDHANYFLTSADPVYPGGEVTAIGIDPTKTAQVYAAFVKRGGPAVIVFSENDGKTWRRLASLPDRISLLAVKDGSVTALSGAAAYRILPDGHATEIGRVPGQVTSASAARSQTALWMYATNHEGLVFGSQDSGAHWQQITPSLGQSSGRFEAVAASERQPEVAYVGFRGLQLEPGTEHLYNGIAKTTDGGHAWKVVFKESTRAADNLKGTWIDERATQNGESIFFDSPYSLGVAPTNPDVAYATDLFRTYRTLDGGISWQEMNSTRVNGDAWRSTGLDVTTDYGVQFDPFDKKHMFIDYTDIGLFQSHDGGSSWKSSTEGIPDMWRNTTYWLAFDPAVRGRMWGAFSGVHDLPRPKMWRTRSPQRFTGGVAVSNDGGAHWQPSGTGMPSASVTHILLDPESPENNRTLYATVFGHGVYKSTDDGKTWALKNKGIEAAEPFVWRLTRVADGTIYLVVARRNEGRERTPAGAGALYRSVDKAEHWERMDLPKGVSGPTGLTVDPRNQQRLYLTAWGEEGKDADRGGGVYVSENDGKSWRTLYTQTQHVYDLTIDPHNPDVLYVCGFDAAAFRSTDRGVHWTRIAGYNFKWGHRVIIDPVDPSQIYITTYGGGVWHGPAAGDGTHHEDVGTPVAVAQ